MRNKNIRKKMVVVVTGTCPIGKFLLSIDLWRRQFRMFADLEDFTNNFDEKEGEKKWEYALIQYVPFSELQHVRSILNTSFEFYQVSVNTYESPIEDLPAEQMGSDVAFVNNGSVAHLYDQFDRFFVWGSRDMVRR